MTSTSGRGIAVRAATIVALVLTSLLVYTSWGAIVGMLQTAKWRPLIVALVSLALANSGMALVFATLVRQYVGEAATIRWLAGAFLLSQSGKYVPGRVWGVALQAMLLPHQGATKGVITANVELALCNVAMVTGAGAAFLAWQQLGALSACIILIGTLAVVIGAMRAGVTQQLSFLFWRLCPRLVHGDPINPAHTAGVVGAKSGAILYVGMSCFLVMYCLGWWVLAAATTELGPQIRMGVIAALSLSYIVGAVSMLPGGIGAREGALVLLGPAVGVSHADMAALAVASRVAIVFVDIFSAAIGMMLLAPRIDRES